MEPTLQPISAGSDPAEDDKIDRDLPDGTAPDTSSSPPDGGTSPGTAND